MSGNLPVILIELVLVFGGALLFAWWQLRDVKRAERETAARKKQAADSATDIPPVESGPTR